MEYFYNFGAFIILISWSLTNVFLVRLTAIVGYLIILQYSATNDLNFLLFWSSLYFLANLVRLVLLLKELIPKDIPEDLRTIKEELFHDMPIRDFLRLMGLSHRGRAKNQIIITEGNLVKQLMLITSGTTYIELGDKSLELGPYHFIGEMSYFSQGIANNTVLVKDPVEFIYWDYKDIYNLQKKRSHLFMRLIEAMGKDIILKMINKGKVVPSENPEDISISEESL